MCCVEPTTGTAKSEFGLLIGLVYWVDLTPEANTMLLLVNKLEE